VAAAGEYCQFLLLGRRCLTAQDQYLFGDLLAFGSQVMVEFIQFLLNMATRICLMLLKRLL